MIPNIFVCSTIEDLNYLRGGIKEVIEELGYNPIMSEYGNIGYIPRLSVEDSCYQATNECQLAIVIIGKRYGNITSNGNSVSYNEFNKLKEKKIPIITLVDKEVLTYKKVYDLNRGDIPFPEMENPTKTFNFIEEICNSEINNGIISFSNINEAKENLKKQMAHIVGDFLRNMYNPIKLELKDILSEITTLRVELLKNNESDYKPFLNTLKIILKNRHDEIRRILGEILFSNIENAVNAITNSKDFDEILKITKCKIRINENLIEEIRGSHLPKRIKFRDPKYIEDAPLTYLFMGRLNKETVSDKKNEYVYGYGDDILVMDTEGKRYLSSLYDKLKKEIAEIKDKK